MAPLNNRFHGIGPSWRRRCLRCGTVALLLLPAAAAPLLSQQSEDTVPVASENEKEERAAAATAAEQASPERTFRLYSRRAVGVRLRPNDGTRLQLLEPIFSPVTADFDDRERRTGPLSSVRATVAVLDVDGTRDSAKGQEFRDLGEDAALGLDAQYRSDETWFRLTGRHLLLDDEDARLDVRRFDVLSASLTWSEIPHNYAFDVPSLYTGIGSGELLVADDVQAFLQGSSDAVDAAQRARQVVADRAAATDLAHGRERFGLELDITAFDPLAIEVVHRDESRQGVRPWSGSFGLASVVEIPWPVDYDSEDTTITAEWARGKTLLRGSYRRADFDNGVSDVLFDNPWRLVDSPGGFLSSFAAGPATGRIDLYPNNSQEEQTLVAMRRGLPGAGNLMLSLSWGELRQDDPLLPYTTNTTVTGTSGDGLPFDASDPANRPATSANARLETRLIHVRWTMQPLDFLEIEAELRDYELDNETAQIFLPGFALEDTLFRSFFGEPGGAYTNLPIAYGTTTLGLELDFELASRTHLAVGFESHEMDRELREVRTTEEDRYEISLDSKPAAWADLRASFLHHERRAGDYVFDQFYRQQGIGFIPALPFLVKFDEASRDRDRFQLISSFYPSESLILGASAILGSDDYFDSPFGVQEDEHEVYAVDLSYLFGERATLFGSYSFERYDMRIMGREWLAFGPGDPFRTDTGLDSPSNWRADARDDLDTFTFGLDFVLVPERLHLDLAYSYSESDGRIGYDSPRGPNDANPFEPQDFEDVDDVTFYNLNPKLEVFFADRRSLLIGYVREKYDLADFNNQGFQLVPTTPDGGFNGGLFMGSFPFDFDIEAIYVELRLGF